MAWRCSGNTNEELIQNMKNSGLFESEKVAEVSSSSADGFQAMIIQI